MRHPPLHRLPPLQSSPGGEPAVSKQGKREGRQVHEDSKDRAPHSKGECKPRLCDRMPAAMLAPPPISLGIGLPGHAAHTFRQRGPPVPPPIIPASNKKPSQQGRASPLTPQTHAQVPKPPTPTAMSPKPPFQRPSPQPQTSCSHRVEGSRQRCAAHYRGHSAGGGRHAAASHVPKGGHQARCEAARPEHFAQGVQRRWRQRGARNPGHAGALARAHTVQSTWRRGGGRSQLSAHKKRYTHARDHQHTAHAAQGGKPSSVRHGPRRTVSAGPACWAREGYMSKAAPGCPLRHSARMASKDVISEGCTCARRNKPDKTRHDAFAQTVNNAHTTTPAGRKKGGGGGTSQPLV
jgi:hypothetical protein